MQKVVVDYKKFKIDMWTDTKKVQPQHGKRVLLLCKPKGAVAGSPIDKQRFVIIGELGYTDEHADHYFSDRLFRDQMGINLGSDSMAHATRAEQPLSVNEKYTSYDEINRKFDVIGWQPLPEEE